MSIPLYCAHEARAAAAVVSRPRARGSAEWICLEEECRRECLCRCRVGTSDFLLCAFRFSLRLCAKIRLARLSFHAKAQRTVLKSLRNRPDHIASTFSQKAKRRR